MHKALNMSKSEFRSLCNKMDYLEFINSLKEKIEDNLLELNDGNKKLEKDFSHFLTGSYALDMKNCL